MSEYHSQTTNFRDRDCLVAALAEVGYSTVEVHEVGQQLIDFQGCPTQYLDKNGDKANVIVRRQHVGSAANDLGFKLDPVTGSYSAIVSEFDSRKHGTTWFNGLKRAYTEKVAVKTAAKAGFRFLGKKVVNGKVQLQYLDTRA
jgi:hypothetical protein